jgi:hypothetical protein
MEWVGVGMVLVGAVLVWSAAKNADPVAELKTTLSTGSPPPPDNPKTGLSTSAG